MRQTAAEFRSEQRVLRGPRSPQHFEAEGTGCAAVGVPQNDELHVRILNYDFFAARGRVSCLGTLKRGVNGDTTGDCTCALHLQS